MDEGNHRRRERTGNRGIQIRKQRDDREGEEWKEAETERRKQKGRKEKDWKEGDKGNERGRKERKNIESGGVMAGKGE